MGSNFGGERKNSETTAVRGAINGEKVVTCLERKRSSTQGLGDGGGALSEVAGMARKPKNREKMEMQGSGRTSGGLEGQDGAGRAWRGVGSGRKVSHAPARGSASGVSEYVVVSRKISPEKVAGVVEIPTAMRLSGVVREENEGTGVKHGHWNGFAGIDYTAKLKKKIRNIPKHFWGDAVLNLLIAAYLINRMPSKGENLKNSLETTHNDKTMEIQVYTRRPWNKSRIVETYKAFTSHITLKSILKNVEKALANPKWKKTIDEVTKALKKNGRLGILWIYPKKALSDMQMKIIHKEADYAYYVDDNIITETGMLECKPTKNPIDLSHKFSAVTNGAPMDKERYLLLNEKGEKVEEQLGVVLANTVE
ncbi:hypothetical protein CK203_088063 [Vitis vinifera]|uniref:Uncharacterized protein n=1 Tax=Vitis vinifera TaxID=29760 RepID=A0A438DBQ0_VITVI|nr:hypothetical protein CK203_088063 [Vitis vinifera]